MRQLTALAWLPYLKAIRVAGKHDPPWGRAIGTPPTMEYINGPLSFGCFCKLQVHYFGVLITRALLVGSISGPLTVGNSRLERGGEDINVDFDIGSGSGGAWRMMAVKGSRLLENPDLHTAGASSITKIMVPCSESGYSIIDLNYTSK